MSESMYDYMRKTMSSMNINFPFYIDRVIVDDDYCISYKGCYYVRDRDGFERAYSACTVKNYSPMINGVVLQPH